jgi:hypothetical protein
MTFRRAVSFACLGGLLMLGAWVYVRAQAPRKGAAVRANPSADFAPSTFQPTPPPPTRFVHPTGPGTTVVPASASARPSLAPGDLRPTEQLPARVELTSGLVLSGTLAAEPLACQAAFGPVSIPLGKIRGVRLHDAESAAEESAAHHPTAETGTTTPPATDLAPLPAGPETSLPSPSFGTFPPSSVTPAIPQSTSGTAPAGPAATVILTNGDSLTVALQAELLQLKTAWGVASIEVAHIRSILLLENGGAGEGKGEATHEWQQHDGRWELHRVEVAPAESPAEDASEPVDNIPSLPGYESDVSAPGLPDLSAPARNSPEIRPEADEAPSLLPPRSAEPVEAPDASESNAAPLLEPA